MLAELSPVETLVKSYCISRSGLVRRTGMLEDPSLYTDTADRL